MAKLNKSVKNNFLLEPGSLPFPHQQEQLRRQLAGLLKSDHSGAVAEPDLRELKAGLNHVKQQLGIQWALNLVKQIQVIKKTRKPTLAFYDHTLHIIGGGQKYGLTLVHALRDLFDITLLVHRPVSHRNLREWYDISLDDCPVKVIEMPEFPSDNPHLDPAKISRSTGNPFHRVSLASGDYDFFVNNSMNEMVFPMANVSLMVCHFPERRPRSYFYSDYYSKIIYNSRYTAGWIEKKWNFSPHKHIYPPVDMEPEQQNLNKEKIILSVARFEQGGSKKQREMVKTFLQIRKQFPDLARNWRLILAGGSPEPNPYLESIREEVSRNKDCGIHIKVNISSEELKSIYRKAAIFWHMCGLNQTDPALVEHFGMTIVEAMQNRIVPIAFNGGGQREIVSPGKTGFLAGSLNQLMRFTIQLMDNPEKVSTMAESCLEASRQFNRSRFIEETREYFARLLQEYSYIQDSQ